MRMNDSAPRRVISFGVYQCDLSAGELRKNGLRLKISDQPFRLLAILLERPGEMFTRQELEARLWPEGTFVGFEDSLNAAMNKLRRILDDESENPRFIETIPRKGYRFISPITEVSGNGLQTRASVTPAIHEHGNGGMARDSISSKRSRTGFASLLAFGAVALVIFGGLADWLLHGRPALSFNRSDAVLITDFENQTGDARFDYALGTAFRVSLEQSRQVNIFPHDQLGPVLQMMGKGANERITRVVAREICQRENIRGLIAVSVTRTGEEYELTAQLIDPLTDDTVRAYSQRSDGENHLLDALEKISGEVRQDLGESLYQIHRAQMPLEQATTPSLQALKDFSNGKLLWHAGKYNDALASFQAAVAIDPDFAMANAALGQAYYSFVYNNYSDGQRYYEKALADTARVTPREREIIETHYTEDRGHIPDAIQLYERYLQEYPDDLGMRFNYARLLRMNGYAAKGIEQDEQILHIAPNDAHTYVDMATAYHSLGQLTASLSAYDKAFQIDPHIRVAGDISREYGFTLVRNGQIIEAKHFFSSLSGDPVVEEQGIRSLGLLNLYRGDYREAEKYLEQALRIDVARKQAFSVARVRYLLAAAALGEGHKQAEIAQLDLIMLSFPALQPKVAYGSFVGQAYARAGEVAKAEKILGQIAPLADNRSQQQLSYLAILRAEIADAKGENAQALNFLEKPKAGDSTSVAPLTLDTLGRTYQAAGDIDRAIASYEKLLTLPAGCEGWEPQQACLEDQYTLAEDYARIGERQKALNRVGSFLALWKDSDPDLPLKKKALQLQSSLLRQE